MKKIITSFMITNMILGVAFSNIVTAENVKNISTKVEKTDTVKKSLQTNNVEITKQAENAELIGLKANSDLGYTRIVLELKNRESYWDVHYDKENNILEVVLPNTINKVTNSTINQRKGAVLKNITMEQYKNGSLHLLLQANQAVQHNLFVLENPERLVIDLFTNYSQKMQRKITDDIKYIQWDRSIDSGRLRIYILDTDIGAHFMRESNINGLALSAWEEQVKSEVLMPIDTKEYYKDVKKYWFLNKSNEGWKLTSSSVNDGRGLYLPGISILENGKYVGPKGLDGEVARLSSTFIGVNSKGNLVTVLIEGGIPASIGATLVESSKILKELNIDNAICIARGNKSQLVLQGKLLPIEMNWPKEKYSQIISIK